MHQYRLEQFWEYCYNKYKCFQLEKTAINVFLQLETYLIGTHNRLTFYSYR